MPPRFANLTPADWPVIVAGRFAAQIRRDGDPDGCQIALIGLPDELGVTLNNGRSGAALGPAAFRAALARYGAPWDAGTNKELRAGVIDLGDIPPVRPQNGEGVEWALSQTHHRVTETLLEVHKAGLLPVCIGGGHDLTLPTVRALSLHEGIPVGGVNVDAHLDVRETIGSGMPFRALIDGGFVAPSAFAVVGAGRFVNSPEHVKWLIARGGHISTGPDMPARTWHDQGPRVRFVSFDMDAIDGAYAPGVSAVNPGGLSAREAQLIVDAAGRDPAVRHFDIMELCPTHDDPAYDPMHPERVGRTARLAALLFLTFLAAYSERTA